METTIKNRNESNLLTEAQGTKEKDRQAIIKALWKYGGLTNRELREKTNISVPGTMSGRLSELKSLDFQCVVKENGSKYDPISNRTVTVFEINPEPKLF